MPLRDMDREQMWLLPPTLDDLLPLDHPARFVGEFVDALDRDGWTEFGVEIDGDPLGAPAYHPRALLCVWLYGFMTGVRSCRKLEAACRDQISYLWLTGWQQPDHNTLWRFYQRHRQGMRGLFQRTKRINLTDRDARLLRTRRGILPAYNGQAMVSPLACGEGITGMLITAVDLVAETHEHGLLIPMMEQAEEITGTRTAMTLADSGYFAGSALEECGQRGQQVVVPEKREKHLDDPYHKDRFVHDEATDTYTCPQGQRLHFFRMQFVNRVWNRVYRTSGAICRECPAFGVCTTEARVGRTMAIGPYDAALRQHRAWMSTAAAKEAYKQRKQLVEPVFGIIKEQMGVPRFLLRGLINVAAEWTALATAFNLRTLWQAWRSGAFTFKPGGQQAQPVS